MKLLTEPFVQKKVIDYLEKVKGFNPPEKPTGLNEHGVDIKMKHKSCGWYFLVECKGDPSESVKQPNGWRSSAMNSAIGQIITRMHTDRKAIYGGYNYGIAFPFSFKEFISSRNLPKNKESFLTYMKTGGLPELLNLSDEETKIHYISSLKDTVMLRDIVDRYNIKDVQLLDDTFKFIIDNIGSLFSINAIVNYLESHKIKTNHETISNYVRHLTQSFLAHCAERYDIKGKEIFSTGKKYYLNDLAFKNYLSSDFNYGLGKQLENIIYLHYKRLGYSIHIGSILGEEVDFVLEKEGIKKYVQVAYLLLNKKTADREFRSLEKINDSFEKTVISLDDAPLGNKNGINHICAWELK